MRHILHVTLFVLVTLSLEGGEPTSSCQTVLSPQWRVIDLAAANQAEALGSYERADNMYESLQPGVASELLAAIRPKLRDPDDFWLFDDEQDAYDAFRDSLRSSNIANVFPPLLTGIVFASDVRTGLTRSCWQTQFAEIWAHKARVSALRAGERTSFFVLSNYGSRSGEAPVDAWYQPFPMVVFFIDKVTDAAFPSVDGKFIISFMGLYPSGMTEQEVLAYADEYEPSGLVELGILLGVPE